MTRVRLAVPVVTGDVVGLDDAQAHHLRHVLRLDDGAAVHVVDRDGRLFEGVLVDSEPPAVEVGSHLPGALANPAASLEVWVPCLKGGRTDDLVRQLTELGATRIVPYVSSRTVAKPAGDRTDRRADRKLDRWRAIALEATRQCGRTDLPEIPDAAPLALEDASGEAGRAGVFFWEGGGAPARDALAEASRRLPGHLSVLVGPEGGLAPEEARVLRDLGWLPASLGPRVLRAETAAVAAAVLALHALEEGGY